ncbi:MAG: GtrA family protein [Verrucomicrobia bacterium]|nr:GtrA family protein [Verrucomicrobiota bacterium]
MSQTLLRQAVRFGVVGLGGVGVDMGCLALFRALGLIESHLVVCKISAAELALLFNFYGNERWVFRNLKHGRDSRGWTGRLVWFQIICGIGLVGCAWLLRLFHQEWGWNLWLANLIAIGVAAGWNFSISRLAWLAPRT